MPCRRVSREAHDGDRQGLALHAAVCRAGFGLRVDYCGDRWIPCSFPWGFDTRNLSTIPLFALSLCLGWLVFQEGYPSRAGWRGRLAALELQEKLPHAAFAQVLDHETALARQDRLVAAGLLVLGVAHEFKNTLSYIRAVAETGLGRTEAREKG